MSATETFQAPGGIILEGEDLETVRTFGEWAVVYVAGGANDMGAESLSLSWLAWLRRITSAHVELQHPAISSVRLSAAGAGALRSLAEDMVETHTEGVGFSRDDPDSGDPDSYVAWHRERLAVVERALAILASS